MKLGKKKPVPEPEVAKVDHSPRIWLVYQSSPLGGWRCRMILACSEDEAVAEGAAQFAMSDDTEEKQRRAWYRPLAFDNTRTAERLVAELEAARKQKDPA